MANCEMCGADGNLVYAIVEGVELKACKQCSSFGKVINKRVPRPTSTVKKKAVLKPQRELVQVIVENYSNLIRKKREKMGLKQKELAKFLAERESLIHKMESGTYSPSLELARKLEKQLGIILVEEKELKPQNVKVQSKEYTIGDLIKIK